MSQFMHLIKTYTFQSLKDKNINVFSLLLILTSHHQFVTSDFLVKLKVLFHDDQIKMTKHQSETRKKDS